jgi:hypothetical protein
LVDGGGADIATGAVGLLDEDASTRWEEGEYGVASDTQVPYSGAFLKIMKKCILINEWVMND